MTIVFEGKDKKKIEMQDDSVDEVTEFLFNCMMVQGFSEDFIDRVAELVSKKSSRKHR